MSDYDSAQITNGGPTCVHGRNIGVLCSDCMRATLPNKVESWLERHAGARLIVSSNSVELCCRELRSERTTDSGRYVSRDNVSAAQREAVLSEMVDEMALWEANGWKYEIDPEEMQRLAQKGSSRS